MGLSEECQQKSMQLCHKPENEEIISHEPNKGNPLTLPDGPDYPAPKHRHNHFSHLSSEKRFNNFWRHPILFGFVSKGTLTRTTKGNHQCAGS